MNRLTWIGIIFFSCLIICASCNAKEKNNDDNNKLEHNLFDEIDFPMAEVIKESEPVVEYPAATDLSQDDSELELIPVLSKTRQNEFIALNGRADPETYQREFANYKVKIEPIGWSLNGLFAFRTWFDSFRPASGYALRVYDTVTNERIENSEIIVDSPDINYKYDPETDDYILMNEEEVAQRISEERERWIMLLDRYRIIGQIGNAVEEITTETYQSFTDAGFECWFDYDIYDDRWSNEKINWRLMAGMDGREKIIASDNITSDMVSAGRIAGYYQSPYDNKIVVVIVILGRGDGEGVEPRYNLYCFDMDELGE